ncbi:hypothetical protein RFI_02019 [Reticulomyxa filosa]|uniref:Uncharacterized protein n=1 Tax=Reticulomyxa filosa TaxID=46433 RepID=X6P948_RETFI|nr:hypothetical protein RFI_02019 [Reticulomyxa filosa]|eukprot:ETO35055.1 hypothetical protein RFI_02019 [Reticulomyxa filosa]
MQSEKMREDLNNGMTPVSFGQLCFDKNWILQTNQSEVINHFTCWICKQVTNNALESHCPQHEDMKELLVVGEYCLQQYLKSNSNSCPIQSHENPNFLRNKALQQQVSDLIVLCPLQYGNDQRGEITERSKVCNFKGKIRELLDHLHKSCPLKLLDCWFKPFGCTHVCFGQELNEHLISNIQSHFQLVIQFIQKIIEKLFQPQKDFQLSNFPMVFFLFQMIISEIDKLKKKKKKNTQNKDNEINISNEVKVPQRDLQQELIKNREEIEIMKKLITLLEEKNTAATQELTKQENEKEEKKNDDVYFSSFKQFSTISFDSFKSSKLIKTFTGHTGMVRNIDYASLNGKQYLCSGASDKTVCVWNVKTRQLLKCFKGHSTELYCAKFSPYHYYNNHRSVICSSSCDKIIRFWDFNIDKEFQTFNGHSDRIIFLQFSRFNGGRYLCSGSRDKTFRLWDVETSKLLHVFNGHENWIWCVDISPLQSNNNSNNDNNNKSNGIGVIGGNGYTICSGSRDKTIRTWDIETTKQLIVLKGHEDTVRSVKYGSNELTHTILSGSSDTSVRLWDIRSGQQTHVFKEHTKVVYCVEYLPFRNNSINDILNSNVICSGSEDNTIRFWDIRTNRKFYKIKGDDEKDGGIRCIEFVALENGNRAHLYVGINRYSDGTFCEKITLQKFFFSIKDEIKVNYFVQDKKRLFRLKIYKILIIC